MSRIDELEIINNYKKRAFEAEKKLKELEQENEAYKNSIVANLDRKISKRYEELLDENEKLKEQIIKAIKDAQNFKDLYFLEKQKLEKIEKIATPHCTQCSEILQIVRGENDEKN